MVLKNSLEEIKEILIQCSCGTHLFKIISIDNDYYFEIWASTFCTKQRGNIFQRMSHRLKMIWFAISGKEFRLDDIILEEKDIDELITALQNIKTTGGEK